MARLVEDAGTVDVEGASLRYPIEGEAHPASSSGPQPVTHGYFRPTCAGTSTWLSLTFDISDLSRRFASSLGLDPLQIVIVLIVWLAQWVASQAVLHASANCRSVLAFSAFHVRGMDSTLTALSR